MYVSYTHVERLDHPNVEGLLLGECYVFPKLDGANSVLWYDPYQDTPGTGSRRRDMSVPDSDDNHGFRAAMLELWHEGRLDSVFAALPPGALIYGEWLVPHTLKTYRSDAWRQFYAFDVRDPNNHLFLPYNDWAPQLRDCGMKVVEPLQIIRNPTIEDIAHVRDTANTYLISENSGVGEGVVVKNYAFRNAFGRQVWGKSVRNDFKEENRRAFGVAEREGSFQVECAIAEAYVTQAFVEKTRFSVERAILIEDGIVFDPDDPGRIKRVLAEKRGQLIPRLLQTVYQELLNEETASFVKRFKDPTIDFRKLRTFVTQQTKKFAGDLF